MPVAYESEFWRDVAPRFDVLAYLARFGAAAKSGANHTIRTCPLCGNTSGAKFYVRVAKTHKNGMWNSYCCHGAGNLVSLVRKVEGYTSNVEAEWHIEALAGAAGIVALGSAADPPAIPEPARPPADVQFPYPMFRAEPGLRIQKGSASVTLAERGVTQPVIDRHLLMTTGAETYLGSDRRRDLDHRLIIPIKSTDGQGWLSWQARDLTGNATRKYLFPAGDRSSSTMYGADNHRAQLALLVEGAFHHWAWEAIQTPSSIWAPLATFGKKLTNAQEELLMLLPCTTVAFAWDLDAAPEIARVAARLAGKKRILIVPSHPDGRDHDELTPHERYQLLIAAEPYTFALAAKMKASLALSR